MHSEFKTDLELECPFLSKFDTSVLVNACRVSGYNILSLVMWERLRTSPHAAGAATVTPAVAFSMGTVPCAGTTENTPFGSLAGPIDVFGAARYDNLLMGPSICL